MPFDHDAELDPQLSGVSLSALHSKYEQQFVGGELPGIVKQHAQSADETKIATRLDKAIKAALADLELLVNAVASEGSDDVPAEVGNDKLLLEIYWRIHDGWKSESAPAVKMIDLMGATPAWTDLRTMFGELEALDRDAGDGETVPTEWYEDLLSRFEARLGKAKPKKKAAPKKAAHVIKEPPPDAEILDYSIKATFEVGQWVRHPKFGIGHVVEAGQHVTLELGADRKVLAHIAAIAAPLQPKLRRMKPSGDTMELARAAGIEIKKVPTRLEEEK